MRTIFPILAIVIGATIALADVSTTIPPPSPPQAASQPASTRAAELPGGDANIANFFKTMPKNKLDDRGELSEKEKPKIYKQWIASAKVGKPIVAQGIVVGVSDSRRDYLVEIKGECKDFKWTCDYHFPLTGQFSGKVKSLVRGDTVLMVGLVSSAEFALLTHGPDYSKFHVRATGTKIDIVAVASRPATAP